MVKDRKDKKKAEWSVKYIDKDSPQRGCPADRSKNKAEVFIKDISYASGLISKNAVTGLKKLAETNTCEQLGKSIGVFRGDIESGWKRPEKVIAKDAIKIKGNPFGVIIGSFARCSAEELKKGYKATARYSGKAYKKSRIAILVRMWKIEHPSATKMEAETAAKTIKQLFKYKEEDFDEKEQ